MASFWYLFFQISGVDFHPKFESQENPIEMMRYRDVVFFELFVPSWERSHIPSRVALLSRWVSLGPAWWDMWSFPGGYSNLVVYCREWAGKTVILLWRLNLNRLKPPTSTTHWLKLSDSFSCFWLTWWGWENEYNKKWHKKNKETSEFSM